MNTVRKIPILGWLVGLVMLLFFLLLMAVKRLWIAQARLRVESSLRNAGRQREKAIKLILEGQKERGMERQAEAAKREKYYAQERARIASEAMKVGGIAKAVDKAFTRGK